VSVLWGDGLKGVPVIRLNCRYGFVWSNVTLQRTKY